MLSMNVVLSQHDPVTATTLANSLRSQCRAVSLAEKAQLRHALRNSRTDVVVLDMEIFSLQDIESICNEFPHVQVVCTHRLADERIWTNVMNAGAADCCLPSDLGGILFAVRRRAAMARGAAA